MFPLLQDLAFKNQLFKDQQEKRFEQERTQLTKQYEGDLQNMIDTQKRQVLNDCICMDGEAFEDWLICSQFRVTNAFLLLYWYHYHHNCFVVFRGGGTFKDIPVVAYDVSRFCQFMTFIVYDVCRLITFVAYDVSQIMTFVAV